MTEIRFTPLLIIEAPPGMPGVSKNPDDQTEVHCGEFERQDSAKIKETEQLSKKPCLLKIFQILFNFWLNLSAATYQSGLQFGLPDYLTLLAPLGTC